MNRDIATEDMLLSAGYSPRQVRRMMAVVRPLFDTLREQKRQLFLEGLEYERQLDDGTAADVLRDRLLDDAREMHRNEAHSDHCWQRLAWGDGECECGGLAQAMATVVPPGGPCNGWPHVWVPITERDSSGRVVHLRGCLRCGLSGSSNDPA